MLIFAFLFSRPGNVILLDEPDAHFEVQRQREIYKSIRSLVRERDAQLIISTHSEVLLDESSLEEIIVFPTGVQLGTDQQKSQFRKSLTLIPSSDILTAMNCKRVLYVEDFTDLILLKEFAKLLNHAALKLLDSALPVYIGNVISKAREHFHGISFIVNGLTGLAIIDHTDVDLENEHNLKEVMWRRREIENYLLVPDAIIRTCCSLLHADPGGLFYQEVSSNAKDILARYLLPTVFADPFDEDIPQLKTSKASDDILEPFFREFFQKNAQYNRMPKRELSTIVKHMDKNDIHPDIIEVLDIIESHFKN